MLTHKTVLVMDDDHDLLALLGGVLERQGYHVRLAADGEEGLRLAREARPDLVILDMLMPRLSGFAVLERLKTEEAAPPVIMITANGGRQHQSYAQFLGADDYLTKPFPLARLLESVQRLCPLRQPESMPA